MRLKYKSIVSIIALSTALLFAACSEWTDTESITMKEQLIGEQNPELYAQYLNNLRSFKASDHKITYTWFDNKVKSPILNRSQLLTAIPDSVDVVNLMYPDNLSNTEMADIETIRRDKATKTIYTISFAQIEANYANLLKENGSNPAPSFVEFIGTSLQKSLSLCDQYNYDGIAVWYDGLNMVYMTAAQLLVYQENQHAFLSQIVTWAASHPSKMMFFEGTPANLVDQSFLDKCAYIVLRTQNMASIGKLEVYAIGASAGLANHKFIVCAQTLSLDPNLIHIGMYPSGRAVAELAYWVATPDKRIVKAGMGIYNVQNDFFDKQLTYRRTREAISVINKSYPN